MKQSTDLTDRPEPTDSETDPVAQTLELYEALADQYDSHYRHPIHEAEDRATCRLLEPYIRRAMSRDRYSYILDIGCGTGWLLDQFPFIKPFEYMGVDLSHSMLAAARDKHPEHQFIQSDLRDFVTEPIKGLIVSTYGTLSHLPPEVWVPCLAELAGSGCEYFLTLLTEAALSRKSSLAHTHPHLIYTPTAARIKAELNHHGLPPHRMFGLNPWGDDIPQILEGASVEALTGALLIDAQTDVVSGRRHLLGITGGRVTTSRGGRIR